MIIEGKSKDIFQKMTRDYQMVFPCGGGGTCGKCRVKIESKNSVPITQADRLLISKQAISEGYRLACHLKGDNCVRAYVPDQSMAASQGVQILRTGHLAPFVIDPVIYYNQEEKKIYYLDRPLANWQESKSFYIATVDIGSTTIVVSLLDGQSGQEITSETCLNPQRRFGQDVMSRISSVQKDPENLTEMQGAVLSEIRDILLQMCLNHEIEFEQVFGIFIAGNAVMNHILLGVSPEPLGVAPYQLVIKDLQERNFHEMGFDCFGEGILATLPNVSAFVGGDIVAGILATALYRQKQTCLFVDIGTNGEIVLVHKGKMYSASCAAGPALEGMNITCGMTAQPGAIEEATFSRASLRYKTIAKKKAVGICGSGILALIRECLKEELIISRGNIAKAETLSPRLQTYIDNKAKKIWIDRRRNIFISQGDIRQIQLAKGAILSGIQALMAQAGIDAENIDRVLIAGQFGSYVTAESLTVVGLVPKSLKDKIEYVGNTSQAGCRMFALNHHFYHRVNQMVAEIQHVELSLLPGYDRLFAKATLFK
ncbi:ASKHA domain-containing protein [Facklamia hominis]|uniref:ASKHA domain-containing protein n=1 Tax=Facklamia hominis TaxID=178214 RepID=UPI00101D278A|nr:ASKHA domain-containing protein [Facklamia hominis]RYC98173.1 DUF4445 domain-containing protein [Facklamia hominis]